MGRTTRYINLPRSFPGIFDPRQFVSLLKSFNGPTASPKTYATPGFRFPSWSCPKLANLSHLLNQSSWKNSRAESGAEQR